MITQPTFVPPAHLDLPMPDLSNVGMKPAGTILVFIGLYAVLMVVGVITLITMDALTRQNVTRLFIVGAVLWLIGTVLVVRCIWNGTQVKVLIVEVESQEEREVIRFIQTSADDHYDPRDLAAFLRRIELTGRHGQKSIRGYPFPSGRKGSDAYHAQLVQALVDAGLWDGGLMVMPAEALQALGLEGM